MAWPTLAELVSNFAPMLHLDKDEVNLPSSTDWYINQVGYQAAGGIYSGPGQWNWGTVEQSSPDDYLVAPQVIWASLMKGYLPSATSYVHVLPVDDRTDMVDLQYWLFYPYNGQEICEVTGWTGSTGRALMPLSIHWGDWECVVVRVNVAQQVVGVFFSQHSGGQWCSPNDGFLTFSSGTHPNVYVASGSHANYPASSNDTYEIDGVDVWDVRFAVADYARGGGPNVNLATPNPPVVIQNDAQAILPTPVTPPPWLAFKGRWGQPLEPTLTDAQIGSMVAAAANGMQLSSAVEDAVQYVANSTTLQAWLSEVILPIVKGDLTGPTTPSQKGSWAVTPTFLPFGSDTPIKSSASLVPVALAAMPGSEIICIGMGLLPPMMGAWSFNQGQWTKVASPTMNQLAGLAACATPSGGLALLGLLNQKSLVAYTSSTGSGGPWSVPGLWPAPAAKTGASIGQYNGAWYIAWGGSDGTIQYLSTTDWVHFSSPQRVMLPGANGPVAATIAGDALVAPAVECCGGSLVIVAPVAGLEKGMPTVLGAYVSPDGSNWTGPNLLPSMSLYSDSSGSLAGGPNGTLYCFYADGNKKVRYAVTSDGADWSDSGTIAGALSIRTPSVIPWQGGFLVVHPGKGSPTLYWNSATFE
ncbi:Vps62-related protein [Bradyrhizobium sp. CCBAU 45389]|uniref:Vps62-related protein n=1 Tax=Bradyrhizobium sp. CCBAU 45389 TaxID=858429 RepID=UPI0023067A85|nr:Vps62-related protein [Bradyrhizobium sp. CCBAU 45389]MDA9397249.1 hypothetical protein [Bradyrhizobium sp. CCBAU 45389]